MFLPDFGLRNFTTSCGNKANNTCKQRKFHFINNLIH